MKRNSVIKLEDYNNARLENASGITIIALVITIIVLLILAGVTLGLVFNGDGLFSKANEAASRYNQSKEDELQFLQGAEEYFDRYNSIYGEDTTGTPAPTGTASPTPTSTLPSVGEAVPEEGWTVEQAKGLVKRDGLKAHLGERVQYSPAGDETGVYRIFYYDNEVNSEDSSKGYFGDPLGTLYIKRDFVSNDIALLSSYTNHSPSDGGETMKKMNPKWAKASNGSSIDLANEHCVAWLCDPEAWEEDYKVVGVADYVIGSPSVEMYMKAYGVYKETDGDLDRNSTALICEIGNINGYNVGADNEYRWGGYGETWTGHNSIEAGPNNIFMTAGTYYWWLASPSSWTNAIFFVDSNYALLFSNEYTVAYGVCPIVAISQ